MERALLETDPRIAFRPDRVPIPADIYHAVLEQAERELEEQRREFDEWLRFMIRVNWLEDGFPPGDVY